MTTTVGAPIVVVEEPIWLQISSGQARAAVQGIWASGGELRPPADPSQVGWWRASSLAGASAGPTVLVGHVDSATFGRGALFSAQELQPGDLLTVGTPTGQVRYRVTGRRTIAKSDGLPVGMFAADGPAALVLITCGGPFDATTRHYEDNIVIVAAPAPA